MHIKKTVLVSLLVLAFGKNSYCSEEVAVTSQAREEEIHDGTLYIFGSTENMFLHLTTKKINEQKDAKTSVEEPVDNTWEILPEPKNLVSQEQERKRQEEITFNKAIFEKKNNAAKELALAIVAECQNRKAENESILNAATELNNQIKSLKQKADELQEKRNLQTAEYFKKFTKLQQDVKELKNFHNNKFTDQKDQIQQDVFYTPDITPQNLPLLVQNLSEISLHKDNSLKKVYKLLNQFNLPTKTSHQDNK